MRIIMLFFLYHQPDSDKHRDICGKEQVRINPGSKRVIPIRERLKHTYKPGCGSNCPAVFCFFTAMNTAPVAIRISIPTESS